MKKNYLQDNLLRLLLLSVIFLIISCKKNTTETPVTVSETIYQTIAGGGLHSLLLKSDSSLWATGRNTDGQLGDGTDIGKKSPVKVADNVIAVSSSWNHSVFVKRDGSLWATETINMDN